MRTVWLINAIVVLFKVLIKEGCVLTKMILTSATVIKFRHNHIFKNTQLVALLINDYLSTSTFLLNKMRAIWRNFALMVSLNVLNVLLLQSHKFRCTVAMIQSQLVIFNLTFHHLENLKSIVTLSFQWTFVFCFVNSFVMLLKLIKILCASENQGAHWTNKVFE